jgi:hypothetical protein
VDPSWEDWGDELREALDKARGGTPQSA